MTAGLTDTGFGAGGELLQVCFEIIIVLMFGFLAYELAKPTAIPSFVLAIFIGMLQHSSLALLTTNSTALSILTTLGAAFILFGGGLDTPFHRFRALVAPILSIAFIGTLVTAFLFSFIFMVVAPLIGLSLPIGAVALLGAALASTDPAAIIPSLKSLVFHNPRVKDIAVSESAINDVVGAVLTGVFLSILTVGFIPTSITEMYARLLLPATIGEVLWQLLIGSAVGVMGYAVLYGWSHWKQGRADGGEADEALFLSIPLFCYLVAASFGGSSFLAVFIAGLLFQLEEHVSHVERYFAHTIEGFMKPLIFMLLGASVDMGQLASTAVPGLALGALFVLVIRPIAVFLTLGPFMRGAHAFSMRELLFLSFVRETGVIPAVLLMGLGASGVPGADLMVPIGLWVILFTLIFQPPLTPLVARLLHLAVPVSAFPVRKPKGAIAVLCSRGRSYGRRLPAVIHWADQHGVRNITLLHCPENTLDESGRREIREQAEAQFAAANAARLAHKQTALHFEFLSRTGLLQDNIESLIEHDNVSIIFVGTGMLDYRLADVKRLHVPFIFLA